MKIAITSQGPDLASEVDLQFRSARFFIVVDTETGEYSKYKNTQNHKDFLFAGNQVLQEILELGVDAIITGSRAFLTFQTGSVEIYYGASGTAKEAIDQFKSRQLAFIGKSNHER